MIKISHVYIASVEQGGNTFSYLTTCHHTIKRLDFQAVSHEDLWATFRIHNSQIVFQVFR